MEVGPVASGASGSAQKRPRDSPGPTGPSKRTKADSDAAKKSKRRDQTGSQQHRMTKVLTLTKDARDLIKAFQLHLRILWCIVGMAATPVLPEAADVAVFDQRYASIEDVMVYRNNPNAQTISNDDMTSRLIEFRADHVGSSRLAKQAARVPDHGLKYTLGLLTRFGLRTWRPNFHEDAYSLYNSAHRFIAIDTFRQLGVSMCYDFMGLNKELLDDTLLMTRAYDHFVHQYMYDKWKKEQKYPGSAEDDMKRAVILARRRKTASGRVEYLKARHYPKRIIDLVGNYEGTSDDEEGEAEIIGGGKVPAYLRLVKEGRSELLTAFIDWIDERRRALDAQKGKGRRRAGPQERPRVPHPDKKVSAEPLPVDIAMDYYSPDFYNELDYAFRAEFAEKTLLIAMPDSLDELKKEPDANPPPLWRKFGNGKDKQWMEEYGNAILEAYHIPRTKAEGATDADEEEVVDGQLVLNNALQSQQDKFAAQTKSALGIATPSTNLTHPGTGAGPRTGLSAARRAETAPGTTGSGASGSSGATGSGATRPATRGARPATGLGRGRGIQGPPSSAAGPSSGAGRGAGRGAPVPFRGGGPTSPARPTQGRGAGDADVNMEEEI